jgi:uncharacterized membrane protein (DUF106 family)
MNIVLSSTVIAAIVAGIASVINAFLSDRRTHKKMEAWTAAQQQDIEFAAEERQLLVSAVFVILRKMSGDKMNGEVDKIIHDLNVFINKMAHKTVSKG